MLAIMTDLERMKPTMGNSITGFRPFLRRIQILWWLERGHLSDQGPTKRASKMLGNASSMLSFMLKLATWKSW